MLPRGGCPPNMWNMSRARWITSLELLWRDSRGYCHAPAPNALKTRKDCPIRCVHVAGLTRHLHVAEIRQEEGGGDRIWDQWSFLCIPVAGSQ